MPRIAGFAMKNILAVKEGDFMKVRHNVQYIVSRERLNMMDKRGLILEVDA